MKSEVVYIVSILPSASWEMDWLIFPSCVHRKEHIAYAKQNFVE